jgi:hypothetical protein
VEEPIDAVSAVCFDYSTISTLCMFFNNSSRISEEHAWFDYLDGLIQAFSSCFDHTHRVGIGFGSISNIVCFVQIAMKSFVVERNVYVEDVTVQEDSIVGYAMTDDFVGRGANRLGEMAIIQG